MSRIFGREPAVFIETLVAVVLGLLVTLRLDEQVLAYANAATVAVGGFLAAAFVSAERALPALIGAIKAVFVLVVGLGVPLDPTLETGIVMVVSALGTLFVRQNVIAPVPARKAADGAYGITSAVRRT